VVSTNGHEEKGCEEILEQEVFEEALIITINLGSRSKGPLGPFVFYGRTKLRRDHGVVPLVMRRALLLLLCLVAVPAFAEKVRHSFESSVPRGHVRRVVVDIPAGDIEIRNGAPDRLSVSGFVAREPDTDRSRAKEQRVVDDTTVEIHTNNDEAVVKRHFGSEASNWRGSMFSDYRVTLEVPPGTHLDLRTRFGDVTIDGSFGDIDVDLRAGDIDLRTPRKDVRQLNASARVGTVRTKIGDELMEHEGVFPGDTKYRNENGRTIVNVHATAGDVRVTLTK